ncbi:MAG: hypothetical protein ACI3T9_02330 [Romboutsia timonensis]
MSTFIRLDAKGTFKGVNHRSSFGGSALTMADDEIIWENGISCYEVCDNGFNAVESLYEYWTEVASCSDDDFKLMQLTIFEGTHNGEFGSDGEDLASCKKVISETDALEFMNAIYEYREALDNYENDWDEDEPKLTQEEYENKIVELLASVKAC